MSKLLRIAAVCQKLGGITPRTVYNWIAGRQFPKPIKASRRVALWREPDVDAWLEKSAR